MNCNLFTTVRKLATGSCPEGSFLSVSEATFTIFRSVGYIAKLAGLWSMAAPEKPLKPEAEVPSKYFSLSFKYLISCMFLPSFARNSSSWDMITGTISWHSYRMLGLSLGLAVIHFLTTPVSMGVYSVCPSCKGS